MQTHGGGMLIDRRPAPRPTLIADVGHRSMTRTTARATAAWALGLAALAVLASSTPARADDTALVRVIAEEAQVHTGPGFGFRVVYTRQAERGAPRHRPRLARPLVPRRAPRRHLRLDPGRRGLPARRRHLRRARRPVGLEADGDRASSRRRRSPRRRSASPSRPASWAATGCSCSARPGCWRRTSRWRRASARRSATRSTSSMPAAASTPSCSPPRR